MLKIVFYKIIGGGGAANIPPPPIVVVENGNYSNIELSWLHLM